jgi:hypothetical protein
MIPDGYWIKIIALDIANAAVATRGGLILGQDSVPTVRLLREPYKGALRSAPKEWSRLRRREAAWTSLLLFFVGATMKLRNVMLALVGIFIGFSSITIKRSKPEIITEPLVVNYIAKRDMWQLYHDIKCDSIEAYKAWTYDFEHYDPQTLHRNDFTAEHCHIDLGDTQE